MYINDDHKSIGLTLCWPLGNHGVVNFSRISIHMTERAGMSLRQREDFQAWSSVRGVIILIQRHWTLVSVREMTDRPLKWPHAPDHAASQDGVKVGARTTSRSGFRLKHGTLSRRWAYIVYVGPTMSQYWACWPLVWWMVHRCCSDCNP